MSWTSSVCTCEIEGKGDKAVIFAEDAEWLLPLHQCEEVICHRLTIAEVVNTQQEVPVRQRCEFGEVKDASQFKATSN